MYIHSARNLPRTNDGRIRLITFFFGLVISFGLTLIGLQAMARANMAEMSLSL